MIATGLFSILPDSKDFVVAAMLPRRQNPTMATRIAAFPGSTQLEGNAMFAAAAVVSATAPLFVPILVFQRRIVAGPTARAVKGRTLAPSSGPEYPRGPGVKPPASVTETEPLSVQSKKDLVRAHHAARAGAPPTRRPRRWPRSRR